MNLHLIAVLCFVIAFSLYAANAAIGTSFGVLGFVFEIIAWGAAIKASNSKEE